MINFNEDKDDYDIVKHSVNKTLLLLQYLYCLVILLFVGLIILYGVLLIKNSEGLLDMEIIVLLGLTLLIVSISIYALFKNFLSLRSMSRKHSPNTNALSISLVIKQTKQQKKGELP